MYKILSASYLTASLAFFPPLSCYGDSITTDVLSSVVAQCSSCHGMDGNSNNNSIPSIAGINEKYFKFALEAYKIGNRKSDVMKNFAENLSSEDIDKLAKYYEKQIFKSSDQTFDESLALKGKVLHDKYCNKCHDNNGRVDPYNFGILAGQGIPYLRAAIKEYLDGSRKANSIMLAKLKRVQSEAGDSGVEQLVNFYASIK